MPLEGAEGPCPRAHCCGSRPFPSRPQDSEAAQLEDSLSWTQKMKQTSSNGQKPEGNFWQHCRKAFWERTTGQWTDRQGKGCYGSNAWVRHGSVLGDTGKHWERNPAGDQGSTGYCTSPVEFMPLCFRRCSYGVQTIWFVKHRAQRLPGFCSVYKEIEKQEELQAWEWQCLHSNSDKLC